MSAPAARGPAGGEAARIRLAGAAALALLALAVWLQAPWAGRLQTAWFDAEQALFPRQVGALSVTVVEIDQRSLAALGQWPWPRTELARLLRAIRAAGPAAVGVNILMPEPDALSPERVLARAGIADPALAALPANDAVLAQAIEDTRAVLVVAGLPEPTGMPLRAAPVVVRATPAGSTPALVRYGGALTSIDVLNRRAAGWGLISADPTQGVVRRIPMVASIDGTLVPTLAAELLRVAAGLPSLRLAAAGAAVTSLWIGDLEIPTEADGSLRVYFSGRLQDRSVAAIDVIEGRADPALLQRQLVLIGLTGVGLHEFLDTPLGQRMSGSEIQAQLLENLIDGTWLRRPAWAPSAEALALLLLGAVLLWVTPRWRPAAAALAMTGGVALLLAASTIAFRGQRLLFDAATPGVSLALLFGLLLVLTLAEATRQRRRLERVVQAQREQAARVAGELEAAQRIQNSTLPRADLLQGEPRVDLHAQLTPAREVGGDLYDYFRLDDRRLFVLVGDVAGKGLSASIFMAVSKALYKSVALRAQQAGPGGEIDLGRIMQLANTEISRDNAQWLFVTAYAAILDLESGELAYCNAGHDNPYRWQPGQTRTLARIDDGDGPPLCAVPDYPYQGARCRLTPGETLCLMTDGVAEARSAAGELYGAQRVQARLLGFGADASARDIVRALHDDVAAFAGGAEAADDLTLLVLRWLGPPAAAAPSA